MRSPRCSRSSKKVDASGKTIQKGFEFRYTSGDQWFGSQFIGMVYQEGGEILDASGKAKLNTPEAVRALQSWAKNAVDTAVTNNTGPSPYQDFADEQDVMAFGGPNALRFALTLNPGLEGRVTVAPLPKGKRTGQRYGLRFPLRREQERHGRRKVRRRGTSSTS